MSDFHSRIHSFLKVTLIAAAVCQLAACTTFDPKENPLKTKFLPRWETNEVPYDEVGRIEKVGRNARDGMTGIVDNLFTGGFAVATVGPTTGYIVQKMAIMLGDVIGLIDDNPWSEHIFKGIISRQLLKFGSQARSFSSSIAAIHQTTIEGPEYGILDYVGNETFHTKVYGHPSAVTTLMGVFVADFLVRPGGNFILIFGARDTAKKIDDAALELIKLSMKPHFL